MRITTKSKIALDALLDIAAHTKKGYAISLAALSKRLGISHSYLELIFACLKAAGLIHAHRGAGGGYSLAKKPEAITVKDIVDATGEVQPFMDGLGAQLWISLDAHMQKQMAQITLSQILANATVSIEPASEYLGLKLAKTRSPKSSKAPIKRTPNSTRKTLGPNSVFSFGQFLLENEYTPTSLLPLRHRAC